MASRVGAIWGLNQIFHCHHTSNVWQYITKFHWYSCNMVLKQEREDEEPLKSYFLIRGRFCKYMSVFYRISPGKIYPHQDLLQRGGNTLVPTAWYSAGLDRIFHPDWHVVRILISDSLTGLFLNSSLGQLTHLPHRGTLNSMISKFKKVLLSFKNCTKQFS